MQAININWLSASHEPHVHEQKWHARNMVRVEMCNHDVSQIIKIHTCLFEPNDRIAHTIHKDSTFLANNNQMGILMVNGRHCIRRTEDDDFCHWKLIAINMEMPA